jgi:ribonucleoside-diphosphate reductase beta chain
VRPDATERGLPDHVFRFFTQSDVEVTTATRPYAQVFRPPEVRMMLAAFAGMETVHILAYALLLETLGLPDEEFSAFLDIPAMAAKVDYMATFGVKTPTTTSCAPRPCSAAPPRACRSTACSPCS